MILNLGPVAWLWCLYTVAALALAGLVLRQHINAGNLGIGLILIQQFFGSACALVLFTSTDRDLALGAFRSGAYFWILWAAVVFAAAPLLLWRTRRWRLALIVGTLGALPSIAIVVLGSADPTLIFHPGGYALTDASEWALLWVFTGFACTICLLCLEAFTTPMPLHRAQYALLAAAFAGEGMFHAAQNTMKVLARASDFFGAKSITWQASVLSVLPFIMLLGVMLAMAWVSLMDRDSDRRKWARVVFAFLFFSAMTGIMTAGLFSGEEYHTPSGAFHALWDLATLCLVVFAALRFQLFSIELRAKQGVIVGLVLMVLSGTFQVVQQLMQNFVQDRYLGWLPQNGLFSGIVVACACIPVIAGARKLATRFMPSISKGEDYDKKRREEIYSVALEGALMDGHTSPHELISLKRLRASLGISDEEHHELEARVRANMASPSSGPALAGDPLGPTV